MESHPLKDGEDSLSYDSVLPGFSKCSDQLGSADLSNGILEPYLSSCVSQQDGGTDFSKRSVNISTVQYSQEGAVMTLVEQYEYVGQSKSTCAWSSDSSVENGHSSVKSSERPAPAGPGISLQNGATVDAHNQDGTGLNDTVRLGTSRFSAASGRNEYQPAMQEPKSPSSEPSVLALAGPGSNNSFEGISVVHDLIDPGSPQNCTILNTLHQDVQQLTMAERKSPLAKSVVPECAGPGTSPPRSTALDVLQLNVFDLNKTFRGGSAPSFAATSSNKCRMVEPKSPPGEASALEIAGPGSCLPTDATLRAPEQDGNRGDRVLDDTCREGVSWSSAATSSCDYNFPATEPGSPPAEASVIELTGPGTSPGKGSMDAPNLDDSLVLPVSYEAFKERISYGPETDFEPECPSSACSLS